MKFDFAWTLAGQPRGETPAPPPGKRSPVLPRPVPPRQAHLPRDACGLPHRTPPASRVWRTCPWPVRSTPRRPAKTAQAPPVIPASVAQCTPWKYTDWAALIARCAPACLQGAGLGRLAPTGLFLLVGGAQKLLRIFQTAVCDPSKKCTPPEWVSSEALTQLVVASRDLRETRASRKWHAKHPAAGERGAIHGEQRRNRNARSSSLSDWELQPGSRFLWRGSRT